MLLLLLHKPNWTSQCLVIRCTVWRIAAALLCENSCMQGMCIVRSEQTPAVDKVLLLNKLIRSTSFKLNYSRFMVCCNKHAGTNDTFNSSCHAVFDQHHIDTVKQYTSWSMCPLRVTASLALWTKQSKRCWSVAEHHSCCGLVCIMSLFCRI